jgi:integrase/recombinase XerD
MMEQKRQRRPQWAAPNQRRERDVLTTRVASETLGWEAAIQLFAECWSADHPGIRSRTLGHYRDQLVTRIAVFARERGIEVVQRFGRYDLRAFVAWLDQMVTYTGRPLTPRGKQMALDTAKRFLLWLHQEGLLPEDIASQVGSYRLDSDPEPRATPQGDLEKVLATLDPDTPTGLRNTAMIHLLAFCGLRVSELIGLNASDLSLEEGRVRVRAETSKVRRTRFVDLPLTIVDGQEKVKPEIEELLASYLRLRARVCSHLEHDDALFVTLGPNQFVHEAPAPERPQVRPPGERVTPDAVRTVLKRLAARAGVDPALVTPHRLRHYFGLASARAGVPTTALMRAMGHRSPIRQRRTSHDRPLLRVRGFRAPMGLRPRRHHQGPCPSQHPLGRPVRLHRTAYGPPFLACFAPLC